MFSKLPELCSIDFSKVDVEIISIDKCSASILKSSELSNNSKEFNLTTKLLYFNKKYFSLDV